MYQNIWFVSRVAQWLPGDTTQLHNRYIIVLHYRQTMQFAFTMTDYVVMVTDRVV